MSGNFNRCLEKATSQLLLEPDWDSVLQIVDSIRMGDVQVKAALLGIKKKIGNENPHVCMFALQLLEACVKNCASTFHTEVATKEFMQFMKDQAKTRNDPVKEKVLELIQTWSHAFRNEPSYKAVEDTFHLLKMEGHKFPTLKESDAMFDAEKAPSWKDAETCTRCRVQFGVVQRKHHCRNCGEIFCKNCSSKTSTIPKLGFERQVRVCDSCYDKLHKKEKGKKEKRAGASSKKEDDLPAEYLASPLSKQPQNPPTKSDKEQQEEEELQLALALSKSEHESKEKERERTRNNYTLYSKTGNENSMPAPAPVSATVAVAPLDTSDMDPELARYLNRHYWQQKSEEQTQPTSVSTTVPSAPVATAEARMSSGQPPEAQVVSSHVYQNGDTESSEAQFLSALQGSLEIFVNRMRSNSQRGRPIANDSAVQSLFAVISDMHPQLMTHIQEKEEDRAHFESLQDKLTQLRDAREALDSLREEHREKRRREAEELDRQRQIQMMQKLEIMRQKKHEYLEMQRQHALQRLQEQEREMAARFEQQKQLTHMRQMQAFGYTPQGYPPQQVVGQPGMAPAPQAMGPGVIPQGYTPTGGSAEGSPVHRMSAPGQDPYANMPQGMSMPPQSGMYNMAPPQPMSNNQFGSMGPGVPGAASMPPGGYQPDGQGSGVMGQPNFPAMHDQGPMSMPPQQSMAGPMASTNSGLYTGASGPQFPPQMDGQSGFGAAPPQSQDFQSYNMQDMASALPPSQQNVYTNHQPSIPQQQQQYGVGQQQFQQPQQYLGPQQQQPQQFPQNVPLPPGQQQQPPQQQQQQPQAPRQPSAVDDLQLISFD